MCRATTPGTTSPWTTEGRRRVARPEAVRAVRSGVCLQGREPSEAHLAVGPSVGGLVWPGAAPWSSQRRLAWMAAGPFCPQCLAQCPPRAGKPLLFSKCFLFQYLLLTVLPENVNMGVQLALSNLGGEGASPPTPPQTCCPPPYCCVAGCTSVLSSVLGLLLTCAPWVCVTLSRVLCRDVKSSLVIAVTVGTGCSSPSWQ